MKPKVITSKRSLIFLIVAVIVFFTGFFSGLVVNPNKTSDLVRSKKTQRISNKRGSDLKSKSTTLKSAKTLDDKAAASHLIVAWQPSHQDDTGFNNWHEYMICGKIVDKAIEKSSKAISIKCWGLSDGLTGSNNYNPQPTNTKAFDTEIHQANQADADLFVSIHVDGGAPSGVLGEYLPNDTSGKELAESFVNEIIKKTGLPSRGVRAVRLYSLESTRNNAKYKCLLEIGDNVRDRSFLENQSNIDLVAEALANIVNNFSKNKQ